MSPVPYHPLSTPTPVAFLDRDGVIVADGDYNFDPQKIHLIPGAAHAIAELRAHGFLVVCVTNQSGVGSGKQGASLYTVDACNQQMQRLLYAENPAGSFLDVRYAPHTDADTTYRKPATGLIAPIIPWINPAASFMVGDRESDLRFGLNLGLPKEHCIFVRTGKPTPVPGFPAVDDLPAAVKLIIGQ